MTTTTTPDTATKPQSWDDIKPGDIITIRSTASVTLYRLRVETIKPDNFGTDPQARVVGVAINKDGSPNKRLNKYPMVDENNVATDRMGRLVFLNLSGVRSVERPAPAAEQRVTKVRNLDRTTRCASCRAAATVLILLDGKVSYSACARHEALNTSRTQAATGAEEPAEATPKATEVKLSDAQRRAVRKLAEQGGIASAYDIPTNTSVALIDRGILTPVRMLNGWETQWLTPHGFRVAGLKLADEIADAEAAAYAEDERRVQCPSCGQSHLGHNGADAMDRMLQHVSRAHLPASTLGKDRNLDGTLSPNRIAKALAWVDERERARREERAAEELVRDIEERGERQPDGSIRVPYGDQNPTEVDDDPAPAPKPAGHECATRRDLAFYAFGAYGAMIDLLIREGRLTDPATEYIVRMHRQMEERWAQLGDSE